MRRLAQIIACLAWLCASGGHWDLIQGFAWGRMFVGYARTLSLDEAVARTFDAEKPCAVCEFVADGKAREAAGAEQAPGAAVAKAKAPLAMPPTRVLVLGVIVPDTWPLRETLVSGRGREAPPAEPPRAV